MFRNRHKLIPLGMAHSEDRREKFMEAIETEWKRGKLQLYGTRASDQALVAVPSESVDLFWMDGPGSAHYYCEVGAMRMRARDLPVTGRNEQVWKNLVIDCRDFRRVRRSVGDSFPELVRRWIAQTWAVGTMRHQIREIDRIASLLEADHGLKTQAKQLRDVVVKLRKLSNV